MISSSEYGSYHVYLLYTHVEGVFYVGSGKQDRLQHTKYISGTSEKDLMLYQIKQRGDKVEIHIVLSSDDEALVRSMEVHFIQMYSSCLTNFQHNESYQLTNKDVEAMKALDNRVRQKRLQKTIRQAQIDAYMRKHATPKIGKKPLASNGA